MSTGFVKFLLDVYSYVWKYMLVRNMNSVAMLISQIIFEIHSISPTVK